MDANGHGVAASKRNIVWFSVKLVLIAACVFFLPPPSISLALSCSHSDCRRLLPFRHGRASVLLLLFYRTTCAARGIAVLCITYINVQGDSEHFHIVCAPNAMCCYRPQHSPPRCAPAGDNGRATDCLPFPRIAQSLRARAMHGLFTISNQLAALASAFYTTLVHFSQPRLRPLAGRPVASYQPPAASRRPAHSSAAAGPE